MWKQAKISFYWWCRELRVSFFFLSGASRYYCCDYYGHVLDDERLTRAHYPQITNSKKKIYKKRTNQNVAQIDLGNFTCLRWMLIVYMRQLSQCSTKSARKITARSSTVIIGTPRLPAPRQRPIVVPKNPITAWHIVYFVRAVRYHYICRQVQV